VRSPPAPARRPSERAAGAASPSDAVSGSADRRSYGRDHAGSVNATVPAELHAEVVGGASARPHSPGRRRGTEGLASCTRRRRCRHRARQLTGGTRICHRERPRTWTATSDGVSVVQGQGHFGERVVQCRRRAVETNCGSDHCTTFLEPSGRLSGPERDPLLTVGSGPRSRSRRAGTARVASRGQGSIPRLAPARDRVGRPMAVDPSQVEAGVAAHGHQGPSIIFLSCRDPFAVPVVTAGVWLLLVVAESGWPSRASVGLTPPCDDRADSVTQLGTSWQVAGVRAFAEPTCCWPWAMERGSTAT
jgi:hypothetical protein